LLQRSCDFEARELWTHFCARLEKTNRTNPESRLFATPLTVAEDRNTAVPLGLLGDTSGTPGAPTTTPPHPTRPKPHDQP